MVYGLFRALPSDRAFLPPSPADRSTDLTPASGRQDHTALPSALSVARLTTPKRPPHPVPTFVTTAKRPSWRARDGRLSGSDLPDGTRKIFFARGLDTNSQRRGVGQITPALQAVGGTPILPGRPLRGCLPANSDGR